MNRVKRVNEKILFVKDYWTQLYCGKVDFFDKTYIVDLKSIIEDLNDTIKRVIYFKPVEGKIDYKDLPYICEEFLFFYRYTYFVKSNISIQLSTIRKEIKENKCFRGVDATRRKQTINSMKKILENIEQCISNIESYNYFNYIFKEIQSICLNNYNTKVEIETLKVYLSELMSAGYELGNSSDYLYKFFEIINSRRIPLCNIKNFLLLPLRKVKKRITYIFPIQNLYRLGPIKIGNVLIYNPMRKDLLEYEAKETWYEDDYYLLTEKKQKIFDEYNIREGGCGYPRDKYEEYILWTDCHARISVMALNVLDGLDRAKREIEDVLNLICYSSKLSLNNVKLLEVYVAFDEERKEYANRSSSREETIFPNYYVRGVEGGIDKNVSDSNSSLSKVLYLSNKELLTKAIYWYNNAINTKDIHIRYLSCFISIETLLTASNEYSTIKDRLLFIVPNIVIMNAYYNELIYICNYFRNEFSFINGKHKSIPQDITSIKGLENFLVCTDLNAFRDNFKVFYKYCESPYIKSIMIKYRRMFNIERCRKDTINEMRTRLFFVFSRMYRFRNQIVHSGEINKYQIKQNTEFLMYSTHMLLESVINDIKSGDADEEIVKKISNSQIKNHLDNWMKAFI